MPLTAIGTIFEGGQLSDAQAFSTLLTVQSLLFAALGVALTLSRPQAGLRNLVVSAKTMGRVVAGFLTMIGFANVLMWTSVFVDPWPCDFRGAIVALIVLATILGEVVLAWMIAAALGSKGTAPPRS